MDKNYVNLSFCIWGYEDVSDMIISASLALKPQKVYTKGLLIDGDPPLLAEYNGWIFGMAFSNKDPFEVQMNKILDALEPKTSILKVYTQKYHCEFLGLIFLNTREESAPWIHFDKRYNAFIRELDVKFNLNICFSSADNRIESYYRYGSYNSK
ncbi:DUF4279 domain-containing protein [Sphingobacterium alkalisoli]|uniref:DUF4279 domain-containing protein n=1 Tax=Sphingobacterium alkalisoli TaxID=1874115 RepID=A0A4U0H5D7_9SPHI|nr:DUF4279 domain-containing protein [Sphingobacterium alkalisoli]TJY66424.1 DUF4279 domain-containing protein [Sphingobacterium alkalisoli]GGH16493.1 hypothetical protein GCM10011418_18910 [Sphingobacterium alkalisoli]